MTIYGHSVIVLASPAGASNTHRTLNQLRGEFEMGLIHFPTPIPFSGKSPKKFRGRKVRCISKKCGQPRPDMPYSERMTAIDTAKKDLACTAFMVGEWLPDLLSAATKYLSSEASLWGLEVNGEFQGNPSNQEIAVLRGSALRLAKAITHVDPILGVTPHRQATIEAQQA